MTTELIERIRANVPAALFELPVWLLHDADKVPIYADGENRSGTLDSPEDRARLVTFEQAAAALPTVARACGLGVALGEVPGEELRLCGIDMDHCYVGDEPNERALQVLAAAGSYAERSPGDGLHILGIGEVGTLKSAGAELYSGARYFTVTGKRINGAHLGDASEAASLVRQLFAATEETPAPSNTVGKISEGRRHAVLVNLAAKLRRAGLAGASLEAALLAYNTQHCQPAQDSADVLRIARDFTVKEGDEPAPLILIPPRSPLPLQTLQDKTPPPREWALEYWLPQRHPALMAGRGGIGKTLLAQHLGTALALGRGYVDDILRPLNVLVWAGEDDADELWRRQLAICAHFGISLAELSGRLILQSYEGADISLAAPVYGLLARTPMLDELASQVADYHADYVFLDNIARIYGGNESDRHSVTTFLAWVSAACRPAGICLLGHPAKGIGSEYSGSTAWEGAVRSRLYLSDRLPDAQPADDDEPPDPEVRYLSRRKSNYSPNDWRRLDYRNGVLVPESVRPEAIGQVGGEFARDIVRRAIRKLQSMSLHGNASTRSPEYLPKLAKQYGLLDRLAEKRFGAVMREMQKDGQLATATIGHYAGNRNPKSGLVLK